MPPVFSKITPKTAAAGIAVGSALYWMAVQTIRNNQKNSRSQQSKLKVDKSYGIGDKLAKKERAQVDAEFFSNLRKIIKIVLPGWFSPEAGYLFMVAVALVSRTMCDIWMINNGTMIESSIINSDGRLFKKHLTAFVAAMPAIAVVNQILKYGLNELQLRFRTRLSNYLYKKYMAGFTYYQMSNLDTRIANVDQLLTQDVEKFCTCLTDLYSNISKPSLDIILYIFKLTTTIGAGGPSALLAYLAVAGFVLTRFRRPMGRLTVVEQKLEGEFRYVNSRLITNSEEIAFYNGNKRETVTLNSSFLSLVSHLRKCLRFKFVMGIADNVVGKYIATVIGYFAVSRPYFTPGHSITSAPPHERLEEYYKNGRMLVKLAEAIGRLILAGRDLTRLAGFTARVAELMKVLNELNMGKYDRSMVADCTISNGAGGNALNKLIAGQGRTVIRDGIISFDKVPLITPNGDTLVKELSFEVKSGMNVLVCGPNGCGKSSLFRVLGELWPMFGGTLVKPDRSQLFYIPQRPYMTLGTLRDQLIYPDRREDQIEKEVTDKDLLQYLDAVQLTYVLDREGGWDAVQDWLDVLSGGEKQRIAMARLFYHKPQFAILDECTSAVSVDVECAIYEFCKEAGITLFTVSHRKSLWKHHEYYLHMDGQGAYTFKRIEEGTDQFGS